MSKIKKYTTCQRCHSLIVTRRSIHIKKPKSFFCCNCGFEIKDPYEVFQTEKIEMKGGKEK